MITIGDLTFSKLDDAAAMRLLRALYRVGFAPDSQQAHAAFWGQLAAACFTMPSPRKLCEHLDHDPRALKQVVEALTDLPRGSLGR